MSNQALTPEQIFQIQAQTGCYAYVDGIGTGYGYVPSFAAGIVFLVIFGLSLVAHTVQAVWKRSWWCLVFSVGCLSMSSPYIMWRMDITMYEMLTTVAEIIGWAGRTWSSQCPYNANAFLMQISTLIIGKQTRTKQEQEQEQELTTSPAPTFFTAGIYVLLGCFINLLGRESSVLAPSLYLWIFCTCDVISLVVQAVGGGLASAETSKVGGNTDPGTYTMVAGIVFQLFSITVFVACAADFVRRTFSKRLLDRLDGGVSRRALAALFAAMGFSVLCVYVRSIYRTIELAQGWDGYLITTQRYFLALDGAMMVAAVVVFNFFHPGWLLPSVSAWSGAVRKSGRKSHSEEKSELR